MEQIAYLSYLATIFSNRTIEELVKNNFSETLERVLKETNFISYIDSGDTYRDVFEKVFQYLTQNYRNEYIYKNCIANKRLLHRYHSSSATLLSELRVGASKADIVILNGTSSVYEIKTELDSLDRLNSQIESYKQIFDQIFVVTFAGKIDELLSWLPSNIGILELTKKNVFRLHRKAVSNIAHVNPSLIFDVFRKDEYIDILKSYFKLDITNMPNTKVRGYAKSIFAKLEAEKAHQIMVKYLKRRSRFDEEVMADMPESLTFTTLTAPLTDMQKFQLTSNLATTYY